MKEENTKSENALREEKVLAFWRENKIFNKSLEKKSPKGPYVFYDGPPFATGQIHYGHILGSTAKDVIGRYKTMQGYHVPRKWGWDCHGLPIEHLVEKELGIAGHKEIEKLGIDKFVEHARSKVLEYDRDWQRGIERIGRWVDFKGGYKTMDNTFIESAWWALSELNKKDLIYQGVRVLAYCARCETPIANSEIAMDNSYKDIADISIYVKFKLKPGQEYSEGKKIEDSAYLIAWTTTPWTLPGNTAIAVGEYINYTALRVKGSSDLLIVASDCMANVFKGQDIEIVHDNIKGRDLVGLSYEPVFPYYKDVDMPDKENIWKVWHAEFVTTDKGTGIAHEAPAFGEEDAILAKANHIPMIVHVDKEGRFVKEVKDFAGLKVKPKDTIEDKDAHLRTDIEIIKYLQGTGAYFAKEKIMHSYPHCMRCDTPIIYYALPSYFINVEKVKKNIKKEAKNVNWVPSHLKEGRFKNILEGAPDWNISRNRYWASPLPIWKCEKCEDKVFVSSIEDLKNRTEKSGNKYFIMRHGGSEHNLKGLVDVAVEHSSRLTEAGKTETKESVEKLRPEGIDLVITSPFTRTKETAEIVREVLGLAKENVLEDARLGEMNVKSYQGKTWADYHKDFPKTSEYFDRAKEGDESYKDVQSRIINFLFEVEEKYKNKKIVFVTHGCPAWLLTAATRVLDIDKTLGLILNKKDFHYFENSEIQELPFVNFPHNKDGELDLHRPYIDEVKLLCTNSVDGQDCGAYLKRTPEVLDCWFESGSMPFAQDHFPFENKKWKKNNFPAGFVAEYIGQVRTWFYYTHALSVMLFNKAPFENVISTGTVRAEDGEKMSKSKHNYPDPWVFIDKYGVDALRLYLMSSTLMKGEDANFSEKSVQEIASKIVGRLYNVLAFYELYRDRDLEVYEKPKSKDVLDQWILLRLEDTIEGVTKGMEEYDLSEATRFFDSFVDDLSTWYLRRSREKVKDGDEEAKKTLYFILVSVAKILAPVAPFIAEEIWATLRKDKEEISIHLTEWPKIPRISYFTKFFGYKVDTFNMEEVRDIVSQGLQMRQKLGIPVRQPLASITISTKINKEYIHLIKDELNVKEVVFSGVKDAGVKLDTEITPELKREGDYRELVRALQDMRKKMGLTPSEIVQISFETDTAGRELVEKFIDDMKKTVLVSEVSFKDNDGEMVEVGQMSFKVKIER